ncbi:L-seryl-tRNA(Sec) selenium transferase [Calderihabitans maritimus]|uniref:L-seryl-tRNA(Sec) selenium transferase n=1 Tax=Calderihabitans maritimus TaxID=1246530 RepID=A0A1Z5HW78_9FIRM|nr:L-seryl-tRNA(Sec) selenium transferase [Calderihabitans maritimus]GAW93668.1 L-seryl-tRNA(Sec) selenium transferase [Calderihabitans maritimus]
MDGQKQKSLQRIPAVEQVLQNERIKNLLEDYPRTLVVESVREVLDVYRQNLIAGMKAEETLTIDEVVLRTEKLVIKKSQSNLRPAINATGVIVHTNLGRSVLSPKAQEAVRRIASTYCNLEIDLEKGSRGSRYEHVEDLLTRLTGAEAALVVNNNAAAVLLALNTLANGREAIVSRGQLVEIGGSFRIPEVMKQSGVKLVEVGTTNKTYIQDYEQAITENTALLLKVHTSNYRIVGFSHETTASELVELGKKYNIPVLEDLGSGFLIDLQQYGIKDEPRVQDSVAAGVDVVTFSGDKLLGGPQAGIIVGKKDYVAAMKKNPLTRALRIDKLTLAALEATLREYLDETKAIENIPTLRMLTMPEELIAVRARKLAGELKKEIGDKAAVFLTDGFSQAGGGALPTTELKTKLVSVKPKFLSAEKVAACLRTGDPAVLVRIKDDCIVLDLRTVFEDEISLLVERLKSCL